MAHREEVKFFDYPAMFKAHEEEHIRVIRDTLSRGDYIMGSTVEGFERKLSSFTGSRYAIGVGNCTEALLLSLIAAGVGPGDEVITVSHTFVATVEVIRFLGADPVLIDMGDDHMMDADLLESAITPRTRVVIPVQLNGAVCSGMERISDLARASGIAVIEDSAQALGGLYKGRSAGTFGLSGNFSFYPAKLLGTFGDAGAVVTDDEEFAEKVRSMRNHGRTNGTEIHMWGLNCRMDALHAALLDFRLGLLPGWISKRRRIAGIYDERLSKIDSLRLPSPPREDGDRFDVFQNYELEAEDRDELRLHLEKRGIGTSLPWGGKGVHQFEGLGLGHFRLPRTEDFFRKCLMLPLHHGLSDEQAAYVADGVAGFYESR